MGNTWRDGGYRLGVCVIGKASMADGYRDAGFLHLRLYPFRESKSISTGA